MGAGTLTSRILGLFRDMVMAAYFDRAITDAWAAAFRLPNLFRRLLGEGALSLSLIPVFLEAQQGQEGISRRAQNLVNSFYMLLLIVLGALSLLGISFIEPLLSLILYPSYRAESEQWSLTLSMGRIMFGFIFFFGTYAYFMGLLNALGSFAGPAMAAGVLNISMLIFTLMPQNLFKLPGGGLAWGVLAGSFLQSLILGITLKRKKILPQVKFTGWGKELREVLQCLLPAFLGLGFFQFSSLIYLYFASAMNEGTVSAFYWADRLLELPLTLISASIGSALLPSLSHFHLRGESESYNELFRESFAMNIFLSLPSALGLYFLSPWIVEVLFFRGKFSLSDLEMTVQILKFHALGFLFLSCARVLLPLYFSQKKIWYPAVITAIAFFLQIGLSIILVPSWGLLGVLSAGLFSNAGALLLLTGGAWSYLEARLIARWGRIICCGVILAFYLYGVLQIFSHTGVVILGMTIIGAMIVYFGMALLLKCPEVSKIRQWNRP